MAHYFHYENPNSVHKVDKIIVSTGTNEIKWFNSHSKNLRHEFKPKLVDLILVLKQLFPAAHITFQTVLPIRIIYNYTVDSVHQFNNLLLEVCSQFGCTFYDCFARFLDREGVNPNKLLSRDNWHLSDIGLKVLCRALKFLIYGNIFNPIPRYSLYPRYYGIF
jgi:lysophospholipase L1-like esterase